MRAGHYVGFIQFEGHTIQILPKLFEPGTNGYRVPSSALVARLQPAGQISLSRSVYRIPNPIETSPKP